MKKKPNKEFELFQSEFKKWQYKFGLTGYHIYFKHEPLDGSFADIAIEQESMIATIRLNSELPAKEKPFRDVKQSAKHEALHLLIGRLEQNGRFRYGSATEIYESAEELVFRLENLIP